jgi:hypothetical protein
MSLLEEQCPLQEQPSPIGRTQSGLAVLFVTPSPKKNDKGGDGFVDEEPFINKRKPLSKTVE